MDVRSRPTTTHAVRTRTQARGLFPPIQIEPSGETISVADQVTQAVVLAVALTAIAWVIGRSPTRIFSSG